MSDRVRLTMTAGVARLTLVAAHRRNAIDLAFCEEWQRAAAACAGDESLALIVIAAEGAMFSVGGDLAAFVEHADTLADYVGRCIAGFHAGTRALLRADAPTLLLLGGTAAGGAFSLVCGADMVVAARSAKLVSGYTKSGLTPDGGLTWLLPRRVGAARAFDIIATNRAIGADEALDLGLVARVCEDDGFAAEAERLIASLSAAPPGVLGAVKRLLGEADAHAFEAHLDRERAAMIRRAMLPDTVARLRAFLDR